MKHIELRKNLCRFAIKLCAIMQKNTIVNHILVLVKINDVFTHMK